MRNLTLLTDFYELTMMYGYFRKGKTDQIATFDLFFRPFDESNFCIAAGLQQAVEYLQNLHFDAEDIDYLRSTQAFDEDFLRSLQDFRFTGSVRAMPEGTVVFPYEPLMIVTAPIRRSSPPRPAGCVMLRRRQACWSSVSVARKVPMRRCTAPVRR